MTTETYCSEGTKISNKCTPGVMGVIVNDKYGKGRHNGNSRI